MSDEKKKGGQSATAMTSAMGPPPALINKEDIPQVLPILPLRNSVFFPGGVLPLAVGRQKTIALIKDAVRDDQVIGVVTQRRAEEEDPGAADLYAMGTVARIVKLLKMGEDNYSLVVQGLARFRVLDLVQEAPYLKARVEAVEDKTAAENVEVEALGINLKKLAREVIELMPELPAAATELVESITHPGHLADLIAANVDVPIEEKQAGPRDGRPQGADEARARAAQPQARDPQALEQDRLRREGRDVEDPARVLPAPAAQGDQGRARRDGRGGGGARRAAGAAEEGRPAARGGEGRATRSSTGCKTIPAASSEYTVARTYLDWIADLPWSKQSEDNLDIENARADPRRRPLRPREGEEAHPRVPRGAQAEERHARARSSASSGRRASARRRSASRSRGRIGRKFVRLSLGGVRDEAEIRGHRRTYVGALPGRIIQSMKKAGTKNPVMMLDEIDKLGADFRGDPVGGAARGARPGAEQHVRRPLPRRAVRPVEGACSSPPRTSSIPIPGAAPRPHGDHRAPRLHLRGEAADRRAST